MYCKNCGKQNEDNSNFCVGCGQKLEQPLEAGNIREVADNPYGSQYNNQALSSNPFGRQYEGGGRDNKVNQFDTIGTVGSVGYQALSNHPQRKAWSNYVFVSSLIMFIFSFFIFMGWAMTAFVINSPITMPTNVLSTELPKVFGLYRLTHVFGTLFSVVVVGLFVAICVLSKKMQKDTVAGKDIPSRQRVAKTVIVLTLCVILALVCLIVVASISFYAEHSVAQDLLAKGWSAEDIGQSLMISMIIEKTPEFENVTPIAIATSVVSIAVQYVWMLVLAIVGLIYAIGVGKYLSQQNK